MERRFFLTTLFKTAITVPLVGLGKSVFLDSTKVFTGLTELDILNAAKIASLFDQDDTFFQAYVGGMGGGTTYNMRVPLQIRPGGKFGR